MWFIVCRSMRQPELEVWRIVLLVSVELVIPVFSEKLTHVIFGIQFWVLNVRFCVLHCLLRANTLCQIWQPFVYIKAESGIYGTPVGTETLLSKVTVNCQHLDLNSSMPLHLEGTSKVSCKCDFSKVSDFNGDVWDINYFSLKIF